jgi:hypothetical protein
MVGSFVPALLLGVAFANIFAGIPIDREGIFQGNLFTLLNPYGLLGGVLPVLLFCVHGSDRNHLSGLGVLPLFRPSYRRVAARGRIVLNRHAPLHFRGASPFLFRHADRGKIHGRFFKTIHFDKTIHLIVKKGCDAADAQSGGCAGEI